MASKNAYKPMELDVRVQKIIEDAMQAEHDPLLQTPQDVAMHHRKNKIVWEKVQAKIKELNDYGRAADESVNITAGTATATAGE